MCCGCWKEDGAHQIDNALVREIAALHESVDEFGALHIVVDDDNLEDQDLDYCRDNAAEGEWTPECEVFYQAMKRATFEERVSASGLWNVCWS